MKKLLILDNSTRAKAGIICCIPAFAFFIALCYYLFLLSPLLHGHPAPKSAVTITGSHYTVLFITLAAAAIISAVVLLGCIVHLVSRVSVNAPTKAIWILMLVAMVPVSFILFWYFVIRREPRTQMIDPDIR